MNYTEHLFNYLNESVSPFHAVNHSAGLLEQAGFTELDFKKPWKLENGRGYFCRPFSSTLFAFKTGESIDFSKGIHMAAAHTDWPCLRIKPAASLTKKGYLQANVEIYGGPILATFLDRPLSVAGKLALKSDDILNPATKFIDIKKPIMIIPNVAIHMNRGVNDEGLKLDKATQLLPVLGTVEETLNTDDYLLNFIAEAAGVAISDILDYELYIYNPEEPAFVGVNESLISSPRLDDITSVCAVINGLIDAEPSDTIAVSVLFDHEEIGSNTKQGADSALLMLVLEKMWDAFGRSRIQCIEDLHSSFVLSVDVAHGYHPNYPSTCDTTTLPILGHGFCMKVDGNQSYAWDCEALGGMKQLCQHFDIPYQMCVKRTGQAGGSTIGPILSSLLPVKTADVGVPLLSMHSARELMGAKDQESLQNFIRTFYSI